MDKEEQAQQMKLTLSTVLNIFAHQLNRTNCHTLVGALPQTGIKYHVVEFSVREDCYIRHNIVEYCERYVLPAAYALLRHVRHAAGNCNLILFSELAPSKTAPSLTLNYLNTSARIIHTFNSKDTHIFRVSVAYTPLWKKRGNQMIEATIESITKKTKNQYPVLKVNEYGTVVVFTKPATGVVVHKGTASMLPFGHYTEYWLEKYFVDCDKSVTLKNE